MVVLRLEAKKTERERRDFVWVHVLSQEKREKGEERERESVRKREIPG